MQLILYFCMFNMISILYISTISPISFRSGNFKMTLGDQRNPTFLIFEKNIFTAPSGLSPYGGKFQHFPNLTQSKRQTQEKKITLLFFVVDSRRLPINIWQTSKKVFALFAKFYTSVTVINLENGKITKFKLKKSWIQTILQFLFNRKLTRKINL